MYFPTLFPEMVHKNGSDFSTRGKERKEKKYLPNLVSMSIGTAVLPPLWLTSKQQYIHVLFIKMERKY